MSHTQFSGYITSGHHALYASLFRPSVAGREAVLIFDPFGEEKKCAFRLMVRLARACCNEGFEVLRFDLSGTGESAGEAAGVSWKQWTDDADAAVDVLQEVAGQVPWVAVGVRLGALLATRTAVARRARGLCLIEPVLAGEDFLRDLERRQQIKQMMTGGGDGIDPLSRWQRDEAVDFGGIEISAELARALRGERLVERMAELAPECRTQVLRVSGGSSFPSSWSALLERADAADIVKDKPFWGQLEYYESNQVIDRIIHYLRRESAARPAAAEGQE